MNHKVTLDLRYQETETLEALCRGEQFRLDAEPPDVEPDTGPLDAIIAEILFRTARRLDRPVAE